MSKIKRIIYYIATIFNDSDRKPVMRIFLESIHSSFLTKEIPRNYFKYLLYKKDARDYKNYVGSGKVKEIKDNILWPQNLKILNDKNKFSKILLDELIGTPTVLAYSESNRLVIENNSYEILNSKELKEKLCYLIKINNIKELFIKPNDGVNGVNAFKLNPKTDTDKLEKLYKSMKRSNFIFQVVIVQHDILKALSKRSINTARMHVYYDGVNAEVISGHLRMGIGDMEVDNGASGGIFIPIDLNAWALKGKANISIALGGNTFEYHPDTKIKLDGYQLPFKEETIDILKQTAEIFEGTLVGWDVAFTPNGPMIIEGNYTFDLNMCQQSCYGFKDHDKYKEIFSEFI